MDLTPPLPSNYELWQCLQQIDKVDQDDQQNYKVGQNYLPPPPPATVSPGSAYNKNNKVGQDRWPTKL